MSLFHVKHSRVAVYGACVRLGGAVLDQTELDHAVRERDIVVLGYKVCVRVM